MPELADNVNLPPARRLVIEHAGPAAEVDRLDGFKRAVGEFPRGL